MFRSDKIVAGLVKPFTCVFLFPSINLRLACPNSLIFVSFQFDSTRKTGIFFDFS